MNDGDFVDLKTIPFLKKAQAVRLLDKLLTEYIAAHGLKDVDVDFRTLIDENVRQPLPISSIKSGVGRGNRKKYGVLKHFRSAPANGNRVLFYKNDVVDWFYDGYAPYLQQAVKTNWVKIA